MPDRIRIVDLPDDGRRPTVIKDIADDVNFLTDGLTLGSPASKPVTANPGGRWGGMRTVAETHDNVTHTWRVRVIGTSTNDCVNKIESLLQSADAVWRGRYIEYRPEEATYSTYFELRGPMSWTPQYVYAELAGAATMVVELQAPCAPLSLGDRLDIWDDFAVNSSTDWSFDVSTAATLTWDTVNGVLKPSTTAVKVLYHSARGYSYSDVQVSFKFTTGASTTGASFGLFARRTATGENFINARWTSGAGAVISKVTSGSYTSLASNGAVSLTALTTYWMRLRLEGAVVTLEIFSAEPTPGVSPTTTLSTTLSAADQITWATGGVGLRLAPSTGLDEIYDDFKVEPYTYASRNLPDEFDLLSIPGDAPALMDVVLTKASTVFPHTFGCVTWRQKPPVNNYVVSDVIGWSAAAVTNINGAATSVNSVTTASKFGASSTEVVTPATSGTGANYRIFKRFRKGVTYTAQAWVRSAAQTTSISVRLGNSAANDVATSAGVALSPTWQLITVAWTPSADRDDAYFATIINAATATTYQMDGVAVFDGVTAPTFSRHGEGYGAAVPLGVIEAENNFSNSGGTLTADANARGGFVLRQTAPTGGSGIFQYMIDPSLLVPDDFSEDVTIEVWERITLPPTVTAPLATIYAYSYVDGPAGSTSGPNRLSSEYGAAGKVLAIPGSSTAPMLVRLGSITFPANQLRQQSRWIFTLSFSANGTGNIDHDSFFFTTAQSRAATVSGKASGTVPAFMPVDAITKRVRADLTGKVNIGYGDAPSSGLGGSVIEPPPGDVRVALLLSGAMTPDDPGPNGTSGNHDGTVANKSATVHFSLQPRYRLIRGS